MHGSTSKDEKTEKFSMVLLMGKTDIKIPPILQIWLLVINVLVKFGLFVCSAMAMVAMVYRRSWHRY